jgi:hypothetical protein
MTNDDPNLQWRSLLSRPVDNEPFKPLSSSASLLVAACAILYLSGAGQIPFYTRGEPREGLVVVWGPPKCGKSFWMFDLMMHVALGWHYRGRRVHQGPVVYCAFEGQVGIEARVEAFRQKHLEEYGEKIPFFPMPVTIDLVRDHVALIAEIKKALGELAPVAVTLDTLNRSFQGSESSDADKSAYIRAADAVQEAFECAICIVHHWGWRPSEHGRADNHRTRAPCHGSHAPGSDPA